MSRRSRSLRLLSTGGLLAVLLCGMLSACGGGGGGGQAAPEDAISASPVSGSTSDSGTTVHIKISGDQVQPAGEKIQVDRGSPVTLVIQADKAGELHVHSTPEQHVEYPSGKSQATLTLDQPGVVDVESHALDKLILQLEVH